MCSFVQSKIFHYSEYKQFKHWYLNGDKRKCRLFRPLRHTATILLGKEVTVRFLPVQGSAGMAYRSTSSPANNETWSKKIYIDKEHTGPAAPYGLLKWSVVSDDVNGMFVFV